MVKPVNIKNVHILSIETLLINKTQVKIIL